MGPQTVMFKKIILFTSIALLLLFFVGRLYFYFTDGFSLQAIETSYPPQEEWVLESDRAFLSYLNQPFYYLGKGCQSYAFVSKDGEYVLKFFKEKHLSIPFWMEWLPLEGWKLAQKQRKWEMRRRLFFGFVLGWKKLKDECGLVHVQLNPMEAFHVDLYDKMGHLIPVDLGTVPFVLQKRGDPFLDALEEAIGKESGKQLLEELFVLLDKRDKAGVWDQDPAMLQNLAVVDGKPIFVDLGQFRTADAIDFLNDRRDRLRPLLRWLKTKDRALYEFIHQRESLAEGPLSCSIPGCH